MLVPLPKPKRMVKMMTPAAVWPAGSQTQKQAMKERMTEAMQTLIGPTLSAYHPGRTRPMTEEALRMGMRLKENSLVKPWRMA